jgi:AcrR family transcriptional regulator
MTKSRVVGDESESSPVKLLLDAAERLLVKEGHAAISTRRVASEAGLNHGLIHYYFGSMEELLMRVLERFTTELIMRQRDLYSQDMPFIDKWRMAMAYLDSDQASGYQKIWLELQAIAWNREDVRERVAAINAEWRAVLTEAFENAARHYRIDTKEFPISAIVSLVMTFNEGIILERLSGIYDGQPELLNMVDSGLEKLERANR